MEITREREEEKMRHHRFYICTGVTVSILFRIATLCMYPYVLHNTYTSTVLVVSSISFGSVRGMRKCSNSRSGTSTSVSGNRFHVSNVEEAIVKSHSCVSGRSTDGQE